MGWVSQHARCRPGESQDPLSQISIVARRRGRDPVHYCVRWLWVLAFARTTGFLRRQIHLPQKLPNPLAPWKPSCATSGRYLCHLGTPMLARDQRAPFSDWWWTVDKLVRVAIAALMLAGVILSLAASPPVATRIGLDPFHFFNRHVMFLVPSLIVLIG